MLHCVLCRWNSESLQYCLDFSMVGTFIYVYKYGHFVFAAVRVQVGTSHWLVMLCASACALSMFVINIILLHFHVYYTCWYCVLVCVCWSVISVSLVILGNLTLNLVLCVFFMFACFVYIWCSSALCSQPVGNIMMLWLCILLALLLLRRWPCCLKQYVLATATSLLNFNWYILL